MSTKTTDNDVPSNDGGGDGQGKGSTESHDSSNTGSQPSLKGIAEGKKDETEDYPQGFAFVMIMISVLSSLFLVALVILTIMPRPAISYRFTD